MLHFLASLTSGVSIEVHTHSFTHHSWEHSAANLILPHISCLPGFLLKSRRKPPGRIPLEVCMLAIPASHGQWQCLLQACPVSWYHGCLDFCMTGQLIMVKWVLGKWLLMWPCASRGIPEVISSQGNVWMSLLFQTLEPVMGGQFLTFHKAFILESWARYLASF